MRLLLLILVLSVNVATAQKPVSQVDTFKTTKTYQHQLIEGTRVYLVPPAGYKPTRDAAGFEDKNTPASITVLEVPGDVEDALPSFTAAGFKEKDAALISSKRVVINGMKGRLVQTKMTFLKEVDVRRYMLIFGTKKLTVMIRAEFSPDHGNDSNVLKESLCSVYLDVDVALDKKGSLPYYINLKNTPFKFADAITKGVMSFYTKNGIDPNNSLLESGVSISYAFEVIEPEKREEISRNWLAMPAFPAFNDYKLQWIKPIEINGLNGFQAFQTDAYTDTGKGSRVYYQVTLFSADRYYVIACYSKKDFDNYMAMFRKLVQTFREVQAL